MDHVPMVSAAVFVLVVIAMPSAMENLSRSRTNSEACKIWNQRDHEIQDGLLGIVLDRERCFYMEDMPALNECAQRISTLYDAKREEQKRHVDQKPYFCRRKIYRGS